MQLTNAQAALAAAAQITTSAGKSALSITLDRAKKFKDWLDEQDRADKQDKGYGRG